MRFLAEIVVAAWARSQWTTTPPAVTVPHCGLLLRLFLLVPALEPPVCLLLLRLLLWVFLVPVAPSPSPCGVLLATTAPLWVMVLFLLLLLLLLLSLLRLRGRWLAGDPPRLSVVADPRVSARTSAEKNNRSAAKNKKALV